MILKREAPRLCTGALGHRRRMPPVLHPGQNQSVPFPEPWLYSERHSRRGNDAHLEQSLRPSLQNSLLTLVPARLVSWLAIEVHRPGRYEAFPRSLPLQVIWQLHSAPSLGALLFRSHVPCLSGAIHRASLYRLRQADASIVSGIRGTISVSNAASQNESETLGASPIMSHEG